MKLTTLIAVVAALVASSCQAAQETSTTIAETVPQTVVQSATTLVEASGGPAETVPAENQYLVVRELKVVTTEGGRMDWGPDGRIVYDNRTRGVLYDIWLLDPDQPDDTFCVTGRDQGRQRSRNPPGLRRRQRDMGDPARRHRSPRIVQH